MSQQSTIDALESRIESQKALVAAAEVRLRKQQNEGVGGAPLGGLRQKLADESQVIADLAQQLKDLHAREARLRQQEKFYQQQARANQRQSDQDLKAQIADQQHTLQQLRMQLKRFKVNPWDSDSQDQYNDLQAKVQAQQSALRQLLQQRSQSGTQWGYQQAQTHQQSQQEIADVKNSEQAVQAQLQHERVAQASLQRDLQAGVQTRSSQKALIDSAQADLDSHLAKLQELENLLLAARQQLQNIGGGTSGGVGGAGAVGSSAGAMPPSNSGSGQP